MDSKKLYVGNLSYSCDEQSLTDLFGQAGSVVSAKIITDKMSGRSKGFGFVEMATDEDAKKAIEMYNNFNFQNRNLVVNVAKPQEKRTDRSFSKRY
ncbi:RNA-binding protein [bacterium]|nr:RNA-binding protein [bacterium]